MFLDNIKKRPNTFTTTALFQKNDIPIFTETEILKAISDKKKYDQIKRIIDIILAIFAIVLFSPLLLLISIMILIDDPNGSPIYISYRYGEKGKPFKFYKFRSMHKNADQYLEQLLKFNEMDGPAFKIKNDPRLTKVGKFLRKHSLDELPQFINVLKGDMSIVGPRPLPLSQHVEEKYTDYQKMRLWIKPGLTCYWQIQPKRNNVSFDQWVYLDLKYILDRNLKLDIYIILKTFFILFRKEGV